MRAGATRTGLALVGLALVVATAQQPAPPGDGKTHTSDTAFYCKDVHQAGIVLPDDTHPDPSAPRCPAGRC
eukprot:SAG22_NODE_12040_length_458_cov_2.033426_1_plen_70_part_10